MSLRLFYVVALVSCLGVVPATAQDYDEVQFTSVKAADNIYMLQGAGGNIGLFFGDEGVFLIDDQAAPLHEKLVTKIKELTGNTEIDLSSAFLINTHFHRDHTGGNELMGESGMLIIAHEKGRQRLTAESYVPFFDSRHPALPKAGLPVITFSENVTFHLNGDSVRVVHVSTAHTDGDAFVHFTKANVVHAGDILFLQTYPFIDLDNGGSVAGVIMGAEMILAISNDKTKIIPGHGNMTDKAGLARYHKMLTTVYATVGELVKDGKTLEQIQASKPTAEFDFEFEGFISGDAFIGLLYRDLTE